MPSTFASRALRFYTSLQCPRLPGGTLVMNPYDDQRARGYAERFLERYFGDNDPRVLVLGINPGRFGAGMTGVMFTDPIALADSLGIENHFPRRHELSSIFIYQFIERFGGPREFYSRFFLTAASPLGFTRDGRNVNYYEPKLARVLRPFIVDAIARQIAIGGRRDHAIVLGTGENAAFLRELNAEHRFFEQVHTLEHPRFIMQYRRKRLREYLEKYQSVFSAVAAPA